MVVAMAEVMVDVTVGQSGPSMAESMAASTVDMMAASWDISMAAMLAHDWADSMEYLMGDQSVAKSDKQMVAVMDDSTADL